VTGDQLRHLAYWLAAALIVWALFVGLLYLTTPSS
jgi:hypothetical protein